MLVLYPRFSFSELFWFFGMITAYLHAGGDFCRPVGCCLSAALFSLVLCPLTLTTLVSPDSQLCLLSSVHYLLKGGLVLCHVLEILSRQEVGENHKTHLICFLSLKGYCSLLLDIQYLVNHCFIDYVCFLLFQDGG